MAGAHKTMLQRGNKGGKETATLDLKCLGIWEQWVCRTHTMLFGERH